VLMTLGVPNWSIIYIINTAPSITFPHKHWRWRPSKPTSRSCSLTARRRPAPQEQYLRGITHVRCIDVVRAPVQQSSGRRKTGTGNLAAWRCPTHGVSSNSRARLQTWELRQREERRRDGWMSQGGHGGFI
jgi:hypothetical protein